MARLVLCVLALCAFGAYADPLYKAELDHNVLLERQQELFELFYHIHEPNHDKKCQDIASSWNIEDNLSFYNNETAAKTYAGMLKNKWYIPRAVPFAVYEPVHTYEAVTLFNVLYSAKDYQTFYKTAVYLRNIINEGLFVYVLSVAIIYRPDTQGLTTPPIYEIFPSFFNNGEIMTTAQRVNTHGMQWIENFPSTYKWDENVVIRWNATTWPYYDSEFPLQYFTHDFGLNAFYYQHNLAYPHWLSSTMVHGLQKDRRGELWWFEHHQLLARYYMERLSNGLGEIPELTETVKTGYFPGLLYHTGIPFPVRPQNYHLTQTELSPLLSAVYEYERRIWETIDKGYVVDKTGEKINIMTPEGIEILGRIVESNADSPNPLLYKDFIGLWKAILGNSVHYGHQYYNHYVPLVLPSALEYTQTCLRDPAFYMIWKRVLNLFKHWQQQLPLHTTEELTLPGVTIEKVNVDKLVTYFEYDYMNVTNHLHMNKQESLGVYDEVSVLVQHPRLNHKPYSVRVNVKSEVAKTVHVKFFLAPKYDSKGFEIPLHENTENFYMLDHFTQDLVVGENVIAREASQSVYYSKDWISSFDVYEKVVKKQWTPDMSRSMFDIPYRLLLPKGRVGGMPFVFFVYIEEYRAPKVPYGTGFNPKISQGFGSGARFRHDKPMLYPVDRPVYTWQVHDIKNMWFEDVLIYHKHTPEIDIPHIE